MASERSGHDEGCDAIRPLLAAYAEAKLDAGREQRVRAHLAACVPCRAVRLEAADPTALFMELAGRPLPASFWTGCMEGLRARLPSGAGFDWGDLLRFPRLAYMTAPLATVLVLGAALLVTRPAWRDWGVGIEPAETVRSPYEAPVRATRPERPVTGRTGSARPLPPAAGGAASPDPPTLEEVGSPGARVYRFNVTGGGDETPIYMVVDESIDI
jgi:hypothetical protein